MKKLIKIGIFIGLILIIVFFYYNYLNENPSEEKLDITRVDVQNATNSSNNIIKNLKYEIVLNDQSKYIINSSLSQIEYVEAYEKVNMENVKATFIDNDKKIVTITSNFAAYMSKNHNTHFFENVKINYLDEKIECEKIFLNFKDKLITIEDEIKYTSNKSILKADLMKINLIKKKVEIMMINSQDKVKVYSN